MSYGTMLRRLKQEEEREERRAMKLQPMAIRRATPESLRQGQTPTDIVLAALYDLPRRPQRRVA